MLEGRGGITKTKKTLELLEEGPQDSGVLGHILYPKKTIPDAKLALANIMTRLRNQGAEIIYKEGVYKLEKPPPVYSTANQTKTAVKRCGASAADITIGIIKQLNAISNSDRPAVLRSIYALFEAEM